MVESCNADPQLNQFVRKNLRLIQYKDEGGFRSRVGGSMQPSTAANFKFG